jgi:hypothetical protein
MPIVCQIHCQHQSYAEQQQEDAKYIQIQRKQEEYANPYESLRILALTRNGQIRPFRILIAGPIGPYESLRILAILFSQRIGYLTPIRIVIAGPIGKLIPNMSIYTSLRVYAYPYLT